MICSSKLFCIDDNTTISILLCLVVVLCLSRRLNMVFTTINKINYCHYKLFLLYFRFRSSIYRLSGGCSEDASPSVLVHYFLLYASHTRPG